MLLPKEIQDMPLDVAIRYNGEGDGESHLQQTVALRRKQSA